MISLPEYCTLNELCQANFYLFACVLIHATKLGGMGRREKLTGVFSANYVYCSHSNQTMYLCCSCKEVILP